MKRVKDRLPEIAIDFIPGTDASDALVLHLWQAIQITIDIALAACANFNLGTPSSYADVFIKLSDAGYLKKDLAMRLTHATGFRNRIVDAYEKLDMQKVHKIAHDGPHDIRAFLVALKDKI